MENFLNTEKFNNFEERDRSENSSYMSYEYIYSINCLVGINKSRTIDPTFNKFEILLYVDNLIT